jgi:transposase-like protein
MVVAAIWSYYVRCPRCNAPQRVTTGEVRPAMRVLCWQCRRIFTPE